MIKVLIADDHVLLAESLSMILDMDEEISVVDTVHDGEKAVEKCMELKPDIVLLDVKMPRMDGVQAARIINEKCPGTKVVMLTSFEDGKYVSQSMFAGVDGYLLKDTPPEKLKKLIYCIHWGYFVASSAAKQIFHEMLSQSDDLAPKSKNGLLKDEDIELIRYISEGKSNAEIAETMNFAEGTIRNKIAKVINTIGVDTRVNLVMYALKNNLL